MVWPPKVKTADLIDFIFMLFFFAQNFPSICGCLPIYSMNLGAIVHCSRTSINSLCISKIIIERIIEFGNRK